MKVDHHSHIYLSKENFKSYNSVKNHNHQPKRCFGKELINVHQASIAEGPHTIEKPEPVSVPLKSLFAADTSDRESVLIYKDLILDHLRDRQSMYALSKDYMAKQPDINGKMRAILVDWLVDVNIKFKLMPQTLFLTVNIIDRYLAVKEVNKLELQLLGVTALMIQCKYEEVYPPQLKDFVAVCDNAYSREEILNMESDILNSLEFDLTQPTSLYFLQMLQIKLKLEEKPLAFARYILETALLEVSAVKYNNLTLVAGAIFLVLKIFKLGNWTAEYGEMFGVLENDVKICAKDLYIIMQKMDASSLSAVKRKFALPEFFEVSKYKIEKVNGNRQ